MKENSRNTIRYASAEITPAWSLRRNPAGGLELIEPNGTATAVRPRSLFPVTDPGHWIVLCADNGSEVARIRDPDSLAPQERAVLRESLAISGFLPVIERIRRISGRTAPCVWQVETDRGPSVFTLISEDNVQLLGNRRVMVRDANGIRYFIRDLAQLDGGSQRLIHRFL
ncbi:MAG TPA: DUF1854 domain-containing protein [Verrucomicrobiales bacterium]|nr:DUF1854 domain-containing protein [Verrucomicrobiales bacterium]